MKIKYFAGLKYQLAETFIIQTKMAGFGDIAIDGILLENSGKLHVIEGFCWDGPSGPCPDIPQLMRSSLVHDVFYKLMRGGHLPRKGKKIADEEFQRISEEDGAGHIIGEIVEEAVKHFGGEFCKRQAEEILTAP